MKVSNILITGGFYGTLRLRRRRRGHSGSPPPGKMMQKRSWICSLQAAEWLRYKGRTSGAAFCKGRYPQYAGGDRPRGMFLFRQNEELAGVVMLLPEARLRDRRLWGDEDMRSPYISTGWRLTGGLQGGARPDNRLGRKRMCLVREKRKSGSRVRKQGASVVIQRNGLQSKDSRRVIICLKKKVSK